MKRPSKRSRNGGGTTRKPATDVGRPVAAIRLEQFLREMPVLLNAFDARGLIVFWNRECERVTGYTSKEMIDKPGALQLLYPDPVYLADRLANCQRRGPAQVWSLRTKNGEIRSIAWTNVPVESDEADQWEWGFGLDITERLRLAAALDEVTERERRRLGQELHDGLGQTLTGLSLMIQGLAERPQLRNHSIAAELKQVASVASSAVKSCREITSGLLPVGDGGLCAALQGLVHQLRLQAPGVQIDFDHPEEADLRLSPNTCGHLYRIVQEALNNAVRHSMADRIRLVFRTTPALVTLLLQDNGWGIPSTSRIRRGLGMRTLHDRAAAVNARLHIKRIPRGGTLVRVECPNHGLSRGS